MAPTAQYKSTWEKIESMAKQRAHSDPKFDAFFFKVCFLTNPARKENSNSVVVPNQTPPFLGDVTVLGGPLMRNLTMAMKITEPEVREMVAEIEERRKEEKLTEWQAENRRSEERWLRRQLSEDGPVKFTFKMEAIRLQRLKGDIEWIQNVGYVKTKIDGRPRFGIKLELMDGLKEAFYGPAGSLADVESALGIKFANTKASDGHLVWATLEGASCLDVNSDWEISHLEDMLECAQEVLRFWKWCLDLDHERGTALMTLKQTYDLLMKEDSKLKALWMKDTGVN
ncbi:hypothetical protein BDZ45DRAFT_772677 [Acephala macrosclerotiorum]|nr:hypothetical protein BDZ45DRAFT_772677 [Acephala macrosclerotiorum]